MDLELAAKHVQPDLILDIGANVGGWYKQAKEVWPNAEFFLIEGNEECRPFLEQLEPPFEIAVLSDTEKEVDFYTLRDCATAVGASYYREQTPFFEGDKSKVVNVKTTTLDKAMFLFPYEKGKTLIKIDCQGAELDILKGGPKVVSFANALILEVSYTDYNEGAPLIYEVEYCIADMGFHSVQKLEDVVHPISREIIQSSVLYMR